MSLDRFSLGMVMPYKEQHSAVDTKCPDITVRKKKKKSELRNEEVKIRSVFLELAGLSHTSVKGPHFIVYCKSFLFLFFFPF